MRAPLRIGNAQGFWGDRPGAAAQLISQQSDIQYLTMDYLAEVSLSILAMQRDKNPSLGYAVDFIDEVRLLIPFWEKGYTFKVVVNAGGLNPRGCAEKVIELIQNSKATHLKVATVTGDDVLEQLQSGKDYPNLDTGLSIQTIHSKLVSANAYLGAKPIAEALYGGADIVITGRVADPSLTVACCMAHFNWQWNDYHRLAQATLAGHLIECGTQVTGGISTNWLNIAATENMGFPVVEMEETGEFVVTKPPHTGGCVSIETVKEQLLYEIGDPNNYLSPDVTVSFLGVSVEQIEKDRIKVSGAQGRPPPLTLKVSATYRRGYRAEGTLLLFGDQLREKARRCVAMIESRLQTAGYQLEQIYMECLGTGDAVPKVGTFSVHCHLPEIVLRISVADHRKEAVECFTKELAPLVTSGPQGVTGYFGGRPKIRPMFGFWPCLIDAAQVTPSIEIMAVLQEEKSHGS